MKTNRKYPFVTLVLVLLASIALACGPAAQPPGAGEKEVSKAGEQPAGKGTFLEDPGRRGGKLNMADIGVGLAFGNPNDPQLVATGNGRVFAVPVTNGLLRRDIYNDANPIVGELAKSWEVSKDGLTYTFKLQQGIKFQNVPPVNGREFTSEDAKYTLQRITADPSIVSAKNQPRFQRKTEFGSIKSMETPDKYTLVVNLKEPYAPFLDSVAHPGTLVIPKEFIDKFPDGFILDGMVGTGPYMPTEYRKQQIASYKRNPDYWKKDSQGNQLPYLDEANYVYFADIQTALASFRAGQIDITNSSADITKATLESITKGNPGTKARTTAKSTIIQFRFNMKFKPFQDVRVRRAIHLALDRQQFVDLLTEGRGVISGPMTPIFKELSDTTDWLMSQPGYRKDKKQDIEEAKRLLKEAGYGDGLTIEGMFLTGTSGGDYAALLTDQLKAINVTLKAQHVDYAGVWIPRSVNQEFELSWMGHVYNVDGDSLLSVHLHSTGGRNYGKYSDPKLDELIDKQRATVNPEERRKWAQEAEKYILENVPVAYLYATVSTLLAQPWVHNVSDGPLSSTEYASVEWAWLDKR